MLTPGQAIATLPELAGADIEAKVGDGPTAETWRLVRDATAIMLRIDKPAARALGLDRGAEFSLLDQLRDTGIAPVPLACDSGRGLLATCWIDGRVLDRQELRDPDTLKAIGRLLARLSHLDVQAPAIDLMATLRRYAHQAGQSDSGPLVQAASALLTQIPGSADPCLCHHDIHAGNLVRRPDGSLSLVDWEYAAMGDPAFDLALLAEEGRLADSDLAHLLQGYGAAGGQALRERLLAWRPFYRLLRQAWQAAVQA
jgi:thiamine kinase